MVRSTPRRRAKGCDAGVSPGIARSHSKTVHRSLRSGGKEGLRRAKPQVTLEPPGIAAIEGVGKQRSLPPIDPSSPPGGTGRQGHHGEPCGTNTHTPSVCGVNNRFGLGIRESRTCVSMLHKNERNACSENAADTSVFSLFMYHVLTSKRNILITS